MVGLVARKISDSKGFFKGHLIRLGLIVAREHKRIIEQAVHRLCSSAGLKTTIHTKSFFQRDFDQ